MARFWIALIIPFFIGLIALEYFISRKQNRKLHQFGESVANLNVGIAERITDIYITALFYGVFTYIQQHWAWFNISQSWISWLLLFLATDLIWYWYHRFGHEVNLLWSAHVVHHQSEDFNFTTSVRITVFQALARGAFWCVLPLIGFPPAMITVLLMIHGAYPFFTHTQLVGKLGWLEYIIVTPSHHRVHHSSNPEYLDKNYGDMLIIWDKCFGTYAKETVQPVYGLTKPLNSYSFLWQHFHFLMEMAIAFKRAGSWKEKLLVIFGKPDNIDPRIRTWLEYKLLSRNPDVSLSKKLHHYISVQTILTLIVLFFAILLSEHLTALQFGMAAAFIIVSVIYTGAMLEMKQWVFYLELSRLTLLVVFINSFLPSAGALFLILLIGTIVSFYYKTLQEYYNKLVFGSSYSA